MITLTISNFLILQPYNEVPPALVGRLKDLLIFDNPKWIENEKYGRSNQNIPPKLCCIWHRNDDLLIPRGFRKQLQKILREEDISYNLHDQRRRLPDVDFTFRAKLRDYQEKALRALMAQDFGVLQAPAGSGKTEMALALIAQRRQPALVIVHTNELLKQWIERIETFLEIPAKEVGIIGDGKQRVGEKITVATVQSLYERVREVSQNVGHLIVDGCHKTPARMFTKAVSGFSTRFMLGLSATPWRRDGLSQLIHLYLGAKVHESPRSFPGGSRLCLAARGDLAENRIRVEL